MNRYIDENDVYKLVEPSGIARVHCSQIDALQRADVVEVVRCKDCRHQDECNQYVLICGDEGELAFCSHGERSE